ncbi:hypothetical protein M406DRAFT_42071, partial [Cryphonectria parasitica EP155]
DQSLTAYAQLGVYRLNVSRALISLFDRDRQHIVAEATRTSPLRAKHTGNNLWLCGTAIPRAHGICEHVLIAPGAPGGHMPAMDSAAPLSDELPVSVVPDLGADHRFSDRPYICNSPFNRFYAGVPIRTPGPHGMNIGVYCVFDTEPRPHGLSSDEISFMQDISQTVMGYLECRMSHGRIQRSERMIRGMGNFVEGMESLAAPANRGSGYSNRRLTKLINQAALAPGGRKASKPTMPAKRPETLLKSLSGGSRASDESLLSPRTFVSTPPLKDPPTADLQLAETGRVFAKAANIVQQSLEVDGVLFLDATVRSFGGLVGPHSERKVSVVGMENLNYLSNDDDSTTQTPPLANREAFCNVLGYAMPHGSSIAGDGVPWHFEGLRDRTLQRLLKKYPHGRIFNFEANGQTLQHSIAHDQETPKQNASGLRQDLHDDTDLGESSMGANAELHSVPTIRRQRWNAAESIIHLFPGARSVVMVPLWDGQKKRWAAGGFIWMKSPTRVFTTDVTLNFLRVFGLIIMAEIYRLNTKADETVKSNILGSISHELRSPLHGLVGAVELLHDSKLDAVQQNVLNIIETSGKTLVDTINHLLDYSKINSFIESDKKDTLLGKVGVQPEERSVQEKAKSQILPVELDCLVEEVVESVLAGFSHERLSGPRAAQDVTAYRSYGELSASRSVPSLLGESAKDRVQIYLDIEPSASWRFLTHPGAFRRIVMNLFGNSLKFTKSGFIKISLAQETAKPYEDGSPDTVLLTVADSGKGISDDYLKNHLFTPFCQEDHFAPGTGLGLSLVRQIAVNLGGEVKVASQIGRGTTITVSLPLPAAGDDASATDVTGHGGHMQALKGLKVQLRGFDSLPSPEARPVVHGIEELGKLLESQAHVLQNTCRNWLQMQILSEAEARTVQPDFIIHHDWTLSFQDAERIAARAPCPVLFVCEVSVAVRNFSRSLPDAATRIRTFAFLSQPLGPRKLEKGLVHLLDMWKAKEEHNGLVHNNPSAEVLPIRGAEKQESNTTVPAPSTQAAEIVQDMMMAQQMSESIVATQSMGLKTPALPTPPEDPGPIVSPAAPSETKLSEGAEKGRAVLIADDNAINLKILSAYMKKLKLAHVTAINGLESLTLYSQAPSDYCCILTDISMPTMDGLESARRIRQYERTRRLKQTPIIALTGLAGAGIQEDAVASGIDMFLTRPVTLKRLTEALETLGLG